MVLADVELVDRLRSHGPDGLRDVYNQYAGRLYGYAMTVTHDAAMAEDAVQDSLLIAMGAIDKLREPSRFRSWLFSITRNECLRQLRHRGRMAFGEQSERELDQLAEEVDLDKNLDRQESARLVQAALAMLSPADRDTMSLAIQNDLDAKATGEALGVSANQVHARMSRARAAMADAVRVVMLLGTEGKHCSALRQTIESTNEPGPLTRKRILRHRRGCDDCENRSNKAVLSLASALALPIVAVAPDVLPDRLFEHPLEAEAAERAAQEQFRASDGFPVALDPPGRAAALTAGSPALLAAVTVVGVVVLGGVIAALVWLASGPDQTSAAAPQGSDTPGPSSSALIPPTPAPATAGTSAQEPTGAVVAADTSSQAEGAGSGSGAQLPDGAGTSTVPANAGGGGQGGGNQSPGGGAGTDSVLKARFTVTKSGMRVRVDASATKSTSTGGLNYRWRFGDGTRGSGKKARHTYQESGRHLIRLTVTDQEGRSSKARQQVTVNTPPIATFTVATNGLTVTVDASGSLDPTGDVLTYAWDFTSDGTVDARGVRATHTYSSSGSQDITLTVTDRRGASDADTQTISLNSDVSASFTTTTAGLVVSVDAAASSSTLGGPLTYTWDFNGDGRTDATGVTATHTYSSQGTKSISLTVSDTHGSSASTSSSVFVNDDPVASFTASVAGAVVSVDASASSDSGSFLAYQWDFTGDGATDATGVTASYTYPSPGSKSITLTVTDLYGRMDDQTRTVTLSGTPQAAFTMTVNVSGLVEVDASTSSDPFGLALSYDWTFQSGPTATGVTASHFYTVPGTYAVTLTVTNTDGDTDSLTKYAAVS